MKIVRLIAENFKRLKAVEIAPDGNIVVISGANGQGKTSVLDAVWVSLAGKGVMQPEPIRAGESKARVQLDLGEIVVTRTFRRGSDGETTTELKVENAEGAIFPTPQRMLDSLMDVLAFDPLDFARMDAKGQFNALKRLVPGYDFDAAERARKGHYDRRTDLNRRAKEQRTLADAVNVPPDTPDEPVNEGALIDEMQRAGQVNQQVEVFDHERSRRVEAARRAAADAEDFRVRANDYMRQALEAEALAAGLEREITDKWTIGPVPVDTDTIRAQIDTAHAINHSVVLKKSRRAHEANATALEADATAATEAIGILEIQKREAIAAATLPVPGLDFGEDCILLNGVPFEQASDAERLRASVAIAMAGNPKLKVIRVRDGSLLDSASMKLLSEMADLRDYQVWLEKVDETGTVGFVISDGMVAPEVGHGG